MATRKTSAPFVGVDALKHPDDKRKNIPTAEYQSLLADEARKPVQVAGPFTVDSLSPHTLAMDIDDGLTAGRIDGVRAPKAEYEAKAEFAGVMLDNLKSAGVQQAHKADRISFTSFTGWPGGHVCAEGRYMEGEKERRAAIFIGPEFGTVSRPDLASAAREAANAQFDVLIACAFNYEAHAADPYKALKTTLKAEIDAEAWATLNSDVSRPFEKPRNGRIAVKVISHLGDEVTKAFGVA